MRTGDGQQPTSDWPDPLTDQQLIAVLRELAGLADGDPSYDFGTALDVYNDRARFAGETELSQAACHQVLHCVRVSIPRTATWRSDLMVVNRHLFSARHGLEGKAAGDVLPEILKTAAVQIEARQAQGAGCEVDDA